MVQCNGARLAARRTGAHEAAQAEERQPERAAPEAGGEEHEAGCDARGRGEQQRPAPHAVDEQSSRQDAERAEDADEHGEAEQPVAPAHARALQYGRHVVDHGLAAVGLL